MYIYIQIIFFGKKVIFMKLGKDLALMGLGAGAVLAYQKYNKPLMKKMDKMMKKTKKKANNTLEDMM